MRIWREVFLDIAVRAIRRIHHDFGIWELGQTKLTLEEFKNLNQGNGISFAPEETVRDSISQEIILSGLWKKHPVMGEKRSWWIDREVRVTYNAGEAKESPFHESFFKKVDVKDEAERFFDIDIVFKRIERKAKNGDWTLPALIEAKRFELVTIDLKTKRPKFGRPQLRGINEDILKLKLLREVYKNKKFVINKTTYKDFWAYILVWGVSSKKFNVKRELIARLKDGRYLSKTEMSVRYLPIQWDRNLKVTKSLWIALIQVN